MLPSLGFLYIQIPIEATYFLALAGLAVATLSAESAAEVEGYGLMSDAGGGGAV